MKVRIHLKPARGLQGGPVAVYELLSEQERIVYDPKGGELCLRRTKSEEILVEVRSGIDVQIIRQMWV